MSIGPGVGVVGTTATQTRIGTLSAFDFAYWASTFIAPGTPQAYNDIGPETDGVSLVLWAAAQIGVTFPSTFAAATAALTDTMTVDRALRTRGAILVGSSKLSISLGLCDIVDIVQGRYFIRRCATNTEIAKWQYGAKLPGAWY
jgi:hypothetical protein